MLETLRYLFLYLFLFLLFTVVEIPGGSAFYLFAYHLLIVLLGTVAAVFFRVRISLSREQAALWGGLLFILLLYSFPKPSSSLVNLLLLTSSILAGFLASAIAVADEKRFRNTLDFLIASNYIALFAQLVWYYVFGVLIDLHTTIFPFSESHSSEIQSLSIVRITGFHNEPGTYATWMMALIFLRLCLEGRVTLNHYVGILSIFLTFSVSGYLFGAVLLISALYIAVAVNKAAWHFALNSLLSIAIVLVVFWYGAFDYFKWRFFSPDVIDGTSNLKLVAIDFLRSADHSRLLIGSGFGVNDCYSCESIQDVGLLFNIYFQFGVGALILMAIFVRLIRPRSAIQGGYLLMLMLSKMFIFTTAFIGPIFILGAVNRKKRDGL